MKHSEKLFSHIELSITEGSLKCGSRLPSERQLAERFGLSRSSVREVLQRLKAKGFVMSKPGGGHFASASFRQKNVEPLLALFQRSPESRFDLLEFRHTIEGDCAYYAALRANELDHQALTESFQRMDRAYEHNNLEEVSKADADFHLAIAESSHNIVYLHAMQSLFEVVRNSLFVNVVDIFSRESCRDTLMRQHREIYDAIINAQPTTAREAAHRHIRYVEEVLSDLRKEQDRLERSERRYLNPLDNPDKE